VLIVYKNTLYEVLVGKRLRLGKLGMRVSLQPESGIAQTAVIGATVNAPE